MPVPYPAFFVGQLPAGGTIRTKDTEYGKEHDLYAANGRGFSAPSQTVHWTVCVPLWRERAVRIPSLREKQKALSPDGERAFCGRSDGIRTHGLLVPNQARYQLRYTPKKNPQQLCCCGGWG